jgi:heptosyltransferase-2
VYPGARLARSGELPEQVQAMPREMKKILIIRLSSLGDVILTTPVISALKARFPRSELFFLTKARYAEMLRNDPRISSLVEFDPAKRHRGAFGFMRLISELRSYDFDLLIDLHANLRSFVLRRLVGSRVKLKYHKRWPRRWLMVHLKFLESKPLRTLDSYLEPLQRLGLEVSERKPLILVSRDDLEFSNHFLLERQVEKDDIVVGVHPGAKWETKRWNAGKFARVCCSLAEKPGHKIMLLGDAEEAKFVEQVEKSIPADRMVRAVGLPLGKIMSLIKRCDCLVTNDSGPMHIASALGVPVVAIFGPTHPMLGFAPVGSPNLVLCADVRCCPCSLHGEKKCSKKSRFCMDLIEPEMVKEAVESLLQKNESISKED